MNSGSLYCSAGLFAYGQIGTDSNVFMQGDLILNHCAFRWEGPPQTTEPDLPMVWSPGNKQAYVRTDGITANVSNPSYISVRGGLVVDLF